MLRLNFQDPGDEILLGAVGIAIESATERCQNSIVDLRTLAAGALPCVELLGYYTPGDGGGGQFYWDASTSEPDNAGTIIAPASNPPLGRWKRNYSGALNVRWFGAKGNGQRITNLMVVNGSDSFNAALASGSGADITYSGGVNTVTGCSGLDSEMVGKTLFIGGSQYPGNNGTSFTVASVNASPPLGAQSFTYTNASGVTDTNKDINWSIGYSKNTFSSSDVGKICTLVAPGSETAQTGNISAYDPLNGAVTVNFNAADTYVGNGMFVWGSDDTATINAAIDMASTGTVTATVYFPGGVYMTAGLTLAEWNSGITLRGEGTSHRVKASGHQR